MTQIPVSNLYWILSYAWDEFHEAKLVAADADHTGAPLAPFASAMIAGMERIVRQGPYQQFVRATERLPTIRGRIDVPRTLADPFHALGKAWCAYETPSVDVLPNQLIRTALHQIDQSANLDHRIRRRARRLERRMAGVAKVQVIPANLSVFGAHQQKRGYRFVLLLAHFILTGLRPVSRKGASSFFDIDNDVVMHKVFEQFVRKFLSAEQTSQAVSRTRRTWSDTQPRTPAAMDFLPRMETDIVLDRPGRTVVIDTKYYKEALRSYKEKRKAREAHLYQLLGYLHNMKRSGKYEGELQGVLLYPEVGERLDIQWTMHGFPVRLATLDLAQSWTDVSADLLQLAEQGACP